MKTVDQIAQQLTPEIQANNAATGETNRRLAFIGDGQGNAQPAKTLTPRDVFYRSSLDQNDRGVAILSPRCPIPIQAINGYYNVEVWVANVPGSSQVQIVDLADAGGYATGGPTPLEGLANAGAKPSQDQLLIFRLAPPIDSSMSVFIDTGSLGSVAYKVGEGTMGFAASASDDISDSTNPVTFNPTASALASGEHRLLGIALDPTTGQYFAIPGAAQSTSETLPSANSRSEFVETDYQAIDFTGYYPCGYVYNYYGQTSPVEDDIMRQFDPRLFVDKMGADATGTVTAVTGTPPISSTGGTTPDISHDDSTVTPGSYTNANVTVDAKGHVTAASNGSAGVGDVVGPASATNNDLAAFDGTTGKLIKDSGVAPSTDGTFAANSDALLPTQKAAKTYTDNAVQNAINGLAPKADLALWTNAALPTVTYSNGSSGVGATLIAVSTGTLTIDGVAVTLGMRIGVKDQAAQLQNGLYIVTTAGALGVAFVLTRTTDANTSAELLGAYAFALQGTVNADTAFLCSNSSAITIGTDAITFVKFQGAGINQLTGDVTAGPGTGSQAATVVQVGGASAANVAKAVAALADKFLLQTADATNLPNAQAMGALATGLVKNTTTTGVQSIATAGTDYTSPTGTENLSNKTITASSLIATALSLLIGGFKGIFSHANTVDRTYTFPNKDGTVAMISDVPTLPTLTNHDLVVGQGTTTPAFLAPGTSRNAAFSDGTDWASRAIVDADLPTALAGHTITGGSIDSAPIGGSTPASVAATTLNASGILTTQSGEVRHIRVVTASGAVTVAVTDDIVSVNKGTGAATTVNLPSSPTTGQTFVIHDGKGDAATNNITITPASGNINGAGTLVLNTAYAMAICTYNGTQWDAGVTAGITQLTGDGTAGPGSGSQALTLATVNSNVGTFSRVKSITANAKGLITAITQGLVDLASEVTGILPLANGGTNADLSASGTAHTFLRQNASHVISADTIADGDLPTALAGHAITGGSINNTPIGATTATTAIFSAFSLLIGGFKAIFTHANTADRTYTYPDKNGTVAMTSDVPSVPLTTKGDLLGFDSADARVPIGTNNQVLTADSTQTLGLKWVLVSLVNSITGILGLANGGTGADLSGTGAANSFVKQSSAGAVLSVGTIATADIATALTTPGPIGGTTPAAGTFTTLVGNIIETTASTTLTISSNAVTATRSYHLISCSGASDTLVTINGGVTDAFLLIQAASGKSITIQTGGAGNIVLAANNNQILGSQQILLLFFDGTNWRDTSPFQILATNITSGTVAAGRLGIMTGDSGSGGASGAVPGPATGDAVHGFFGDGTYTGTERDLGFSQLTGSAANFDITSIPATYKHLRLRLFLRSDRAATSDNVYIRFNNDSTAANYNSESMTALGTTPSFSGLERVGATATAVEVTLGAVGNTGVALDFSMLMVDIFNYSDTTNHRTLTVQGWMRRAASTTNLIILLGGGMYLTTGTAINRITILPVTGTNWLTGSAYLLSGVS